MLDGVERYQIWGSSNACAGAYAIPARVLQAMGDLDSACGALDKAEQIRRRYRIHPDTSSLIETCRVRLWLAQGNLRSAAEWLAWRQSKTGGSTGMDLISVLEHMTQARVLIAQGKSVEAVSQ